MKYPKNLKEEGQKFYKEQQSVYGMEDPHEVRMLQMAGGCLDEIHESEGQIRKDGRFVKDRYGQIKEHPAGKVIRENRALFLRIIRELGLNVEIPESRPPRLY